MSAPKRDTRCKTLTKGGKPCRAAATETGLCFFHSSPNRAAELGSIGGKKNRRPSAWTAEPPLESARSAIDELNQLYDRVSKGAIKPNVGNTLLQVMNAKERLNQKLLLELKIAELQNDIKTPKSINRIREIDLEASKAGEPEKPES